MNNMTLKQIAHYLTDSYEIGRSYKDLSETEKSHFMNMIFDRFMQFKNGEHTDSLLYELLACPFDIWGCGSDDINELRAVYVFNSLKYVLDEYPVYTPMFEAILPYIIENEEIRESIN